MVESLCSGIEAENVLMKTLSQVLSILVLLCQVMPAYAVCGEFLIQAGMDV